MSKRRIDFGSGRWIPFIGVFDVRRSWYTLNYIICQSGIVLVSFTCFLITAYWMFSWLERWSIRIRIGCIFCFGDMMIHGNFPDATRLSGFERSDIWAPTLSLILRGILLWCCNLCCITMAHLGNGPNLIFEVIIIISLHTLWSVDWNRITWIFSSCLNIRSPWCPNRFYIIMVFIKAAVTSLSESSSLSAHLRCHFLWNLRLLLSDIQNSLLWCCWKIILLLSHFIRLIVHHLLWLFRTFISKNMPRRTLNDQRRTFNHLLLLLILDLNHVFDSLRGFHVVLHILFL